MGFLDRLLGRPEPEHSPRQGQPRHTDDEIAVERYRYLLRTAPPETIEQVHAEAFSKLTDEQRDILFAQLSENAMEGERPADAEPATLARSATRAEVRQPGTLDRAFGGAGQGMGFGGAVGASLLGTVAGFVVGSALVSTFLPDGGAADAAADGSDAGTDAGGDHGADSGGDSSGFGDLGGGGDSFGGDFGGDFGF